MKSKSTRTKLGTDAHTQSYYLDKLLTREIELDAVEQDRSHSYVVNEIIKMHYQNKGRI